MSETPKIKNENKAVYQPPQVVRVSSASGGGRARALQGFRIRRARKRILPALKSLPFAGFVNSLGIPSGEI